MDKHTEIRAKLTSGDALGALRVAASLRHGLGDARDAIQRGWAAHQRPDFYIQIGGIPAELVAEGIKEVEVLFGAV